MSSILASLTLALSVMFAPTTALIDGTNGRPADSDINYWVHYALTHDPRTLASAFRVETSGGVVKVMGEVDNLAAKHYAVAEAQKIHGVLGVIDEIHVAPVARPDHDIAHDIRRRLENSTAVDARNLTVTARDGVVTLSGEANDWSQKEEAQLLASEVRGVKQVIDEMHVHYGESISDDRLSAESNARLTRDVYLADLPISASVRDGKVTLRGSVGNLYEKKRAERRLRWLRGVVSVTNDLEVEPWESYGVRDRVSIPSDVDLKQNVEAELKTDLRLRPEEISVDAVAGHVMLFGSVPSLREKWIAEQDTRDVVGTIWVTNDLIVYPMMRDDSAIRDVIIFNLKTDPYLSKADMDVSVTDGVVTLTGKVPSLYEQQRVTDLALDVEGVKDVINKTTVKSMPTLTDDVLKQHVARRLEEDWRITWVYQNIRVDVNDGVVALAGDVNTWAERQEAERVAFRTQGVLAVDNRLTVRGVSYPWGEWQSKVPYYFDLFDPYDLSHDERKR